MIHQYKSNGYNIVMDINSGAIHVVDDVVYDIIELYEGHEKSEIMDMLASKYPKEDMEEAFEDYERKEEYANESERDRHPGAGKGTGGRPTAGAVPPGEAEAGCPAL